MKGEIPVRYQVKDHARARFSPGDVVYRVDDDSINTVKRYVVDHSHPNEVYSVVRLDDNGNRTGSPFRLNPSISRQFHRDSLATNLLEQIKTKME